MTTEQDDGDRGSRPGRNDVPTRRQCLASAGVLGAAFLAGCSGAGSGDVDDQGDDSDEVGADAAETDEPAGTAVETEIETETDEAAGTDTAVDTVTETATDEPTETETDSEAGCVESVPEVDDSVAVEGTMEHPTDGTVDLTGRTHGDDQYYEFVHSDGQVFELYIVDDEYYSVTDAGCAKFSDPPDTGYTAPEEKFSEEEFWEDEEPVGTELLDGEQVSVYEFDVQSSHYDYELTVYVSCATSRIARADQYVPSEESTTIAYYDNWGDTEPISPPEGDCEEY